MAKMIRNVDFHCKLNNVEHHTDEITTKELIVRRGQPFLLTLEMMKPFQEGDPLSLTVETGSAPSEVRGTRCEFGNSCGTFCGNAKAMWKYSIDRRANLQRGIVTLLVTPPADAPVGKYSLSAKTFSEKTPLGTLVVLFNPWCSDDWVYLPEKEERQEYVMNEDGLIYTGTANTIHAVNWVFGQFEEDMVDICLKLLDANPKHLRNPADDVSARCNPIYVARVVSAMVNCNDDCGVLMGRWHDDYNDGVRPTTWTGSVSILRRWYHQNCYPVKYGQCWVFAGVMCTVMRFLGIPCRVVTNFVSAHDTNNSLTIEEYYNEYGLKIQEGTESIWNFHVWVEGWMKRPDLNKGTSYDGWQVLDATPQEKSEGVFCCGPAPVSAILQGEVNLKYDAPFVFSEVNADIVKWMVSANGVKRKMLSDTMTVGQNISTKAVGCYRRNDITDTYKYTEGSSRERAVFNRALSRLNSGDDQQGICKEETLKVVMKFEEGSKMQNGQDIELRLKLSNTHCTNKSMLILVSAQAMTYTGIPTNTIVTTSQKEMLPSGQDVILPILIPFFTYSKFMVGCDSMKVSVLAIDKQQDDEIYETEINIAPEDPPISIKVVSEARLFRTMTIQVEFRNPLKEKLTCCSLTITGCGLFKSDHYVRNVGDVEPNSTLKLTVSTTPYRLGPRTLVADFDCSAFRDLKGYCTVDIKP